MPENNNEQGAWGECDALIARLTGEPASRVARLRRYRQQLARWRPVLDAEIDGVIDRYLGGSFPRAGQDALQAPPDQGGKPSG